MTIETTHYKGFEIKKRTDVKTHTCQIYLNGQLCKMIAGDIDSEGNEHSVEKAKIWIDEKTKN